MGNKKKPREKENDESKMLIGYAGIVTAIATFLKVVFDFIIQLITLSK